MKVVKKILKRILFLLIVIISILIFDYARINIRYFINKNKFIYTFDVYGNKDGFVPQGLTYSTKYDVVIQTSYSNEVSKIYVIDFKTGKLIKELETLNVDGSISNKHVGGITTDETKVYISNDYKLDIFDLDEIMNTTEDSIKMKEEIDLSIRGDFCYYNNNILWIGDFYLKPFYDVPNGDPKLYGYINDTIDYNKPDYIYSLPKAVQGMTILPNGEFVFTESFTYLVNSNLVVYDNLLETKYTKFNKDNKIKNIKLPPMAEGMFYKDGYLYILFESSTENYSLADPKIDKVIKYKLKM